jgi:hypothetical protein
VPQSLTFETNEAGLKAKSVFDRTVALTPKVTLRKEELRKVQLGETPRSGRELLLNVLRQLAVCREVLI